MTKITKETSLKQQHARQNTAVTKKRNFDQINEVGTTREEKKIKLPSFLQYLHEVYPPGKECYVKVVVKEETYYVPAVLSHNFGDKTTRVLYMTPSNENERHKVSMGVEIGTEDSENIRDMLYTGFDNNLEELDDSGSVSESSSECDSDPTYTSSVYTCRGFEKKDGRWVPKDAEHTLIDSDNIQWYRDEGHTWGDWESATEVDHRNDIVNNLLEETFPGIDAMINGVASTYTGVEVDSKNVIIGDEAMDVISNLNNNIRWSECMWNGPFQLKKK